MKKYFDNIQGNDHVKDYLTNMVKNKAIANSLLFAGPEEACKDQYAIALAKLLMGETAHAKIDAGTHPDLHIYHPEGKIGMHSIASMRQFCDEVYLPPYESQWKIFILHDAERMLSYSANALLKTFEEPSSDSVIILLSRNLNILLPTILSRCRIVRFQSVSQNAKEKEKNPLRLEILSLLAKGKMTSYSELSKSAAQIAKKVEEMQEEMEGALKAEMQKISSDQMNAFQRHAAEKEMEGASAMRLNQYAKALFTDVLSWYRDMHLIHVRGRSSLLENLDFQEAINQNYQRGEILPLELVEKKIKNALFSLERSTSLHLCLETLFLELNYI